ncbi:MAG: hypothetical protein K0S09_3179 [Sphingobacteriaceae bacterium]|nr:hypothetical protein [Sphingobacteriaceae bacterium]
MGILVDGFKGSFTGRVGNLVGYRGKDGTIYVRHRPKKTKRAPSPLQREQQERMGYAVKFARGFASVLSALPDTAKTKTKHNVLVSNILKATLRGSDGRFGISFPDLSLTAGPHCLSIERQAAGFLYQAVVVYRARMPYSFEKCWQPLLMAIFYNVQEMRCTYVLIPAGTDGEVQLSNPFSESRGRVEIYLVLLSENMKHASASVYAGSIENP